MSWSCEDYGARWTHENLSGIYDANIRKLPLVLLSPFPADTPGKLPSLPDLDSSTQSPFPSLEEKGFTRHLDECGRDKVTRQTRSNQLSYAAAETPAAGLEPASTSYM